MENELPVKVQFVRDEEALMNLAFLCSTLIPSQDERLISSKIPIGEG
ncbi:hypothetical protein [Bacillus cereus]